MSDAGQPGASREEAGSPEGGGDGDAGTQRKQWTQLEDDTVRRLVHEHGTRAWTTVAQALPGRTGKQCRERWHNHLDHDIRKDAWSHEEDCRLIQLHGEYGNKWADIAKYLAGRTDNAVKNHWNSALRRGENVQHLLVDGKVPLGYPDGIPPMPGSEPSAMSGVPTQVEAAKINNLLRTNPQSSLATLIDFPVQEKGAPRSTVARGGLDALLSMLRARTSTELLAATSRLQAAISAIPPTPRSDDGSSQAEGGMSAAAGAALHPEGLGNACEALLTPSLVQSLMTPGTSESLGRALEEASGMAADASAPKRARHEAPAQPAPQPSIPPSMPPPSARQPGGSGGASSSTAPLAGGVDLPAPPQPSSSGSQLRKKRPPGATDLTLVRGGASAPAAAAGAAGALAGSSGLGSGLGLGLGSALGTGGCLSALGSAVSISGYLETPQELKNFASQLSPQLGLTPNAMLDFLSTDDIVAQIADGMQPAASSRRQPSRAD